MNLFRWLLGGLLLSVVGAVGWQLLREQGGVLVLSWGAWTYTLRAEVALLLWLLAWGALWILAWLLWLPFGAARRYARRQAGRRFEHGLSALREERWERAVELLRAAAGNPRWSTPARLAMAEVLQAQGRADRAENELAPLPADCPSARLLRADWALRRGDAEAALAQLAPLPAPLSPRALRLRAEALAAMGRAHEALPLIAQLRSRGEALPDLVVRLERELQVSALAESPDAGTLLIRWEAAPRPLRDAPAVLLAFARRAAALGVEDRAAEDIAGCLDIRWDEGLAVAYGQLPPGRDAGRLARAESWLAKHPDSPALLLSLGRLASASGDGRAEAWLQRAIAQGAGSAAWEALGHWYMVQGDERATTAFRNALRAPRGEALLALTGLDLRARIAAEAVGEQRDAFGHPVLPQG